MIAFAKRLLFRKQFVRRRWPISLFFLFLEIFRNILFPGVTLLPHREKEEKKKIGKISLKNFFCGP